MTRVTECGEGGYHSPSAAANNNTNVNNTSTNTNVKIWVPSKRVSGSQNSDLQSWTSSKRISSEHSISKLMQDLQPQSNASLTLRPEIEQALTASRERRKKVRIGSREAGPNFDVKLGDVKLGNEVSIQRTSSHAELTPSPNLTEEEPKGAASEPQSPHTRSEKMFIVQSKKMGVEELAESEVKKLSHFIEQHEEEWNQLEPGEVKTYKHHRDDAGALPLTVEVFKSEGELHIMVGTKISKASESNTAKKIKGGSKVVKPAIEWRTGTLWVKHTSHSLQNVEDMEKEFHYENEMYLKLKDKPGIAPPMIAVHKYQGKGGARMAAYQPFSDGGSLKVYLTKAHLSPHQTNETMGQLAEGLETLSSERLLHNDLKLDNVLVDSSSGTVKMGITDLGTLMELTPKSDKKFIQRFTSSGTTPYFSPEKEFAGLIFMRAKEEKKQELLNLFGLNRAKVKKGPFSRIKESLGSKKSRSSAQKQINQYMKNLSADEIKKIKEELKINADEKLPPFEKLGPVRQRIIIGKFAENHAFEYLAPLENSLRANAPASDMWAMGLIFATLTSTKTQEDINEFYDRRNKLISGKKDLFDLNKPLQEQYNTQWANLQEDLSTIVKDFTDKGQPNLSSLPLIQEMLSLDPSQRPTPQVLRRKLQTLQ